MANKTTKKPWRVVLLGIVCLFVLGISVLWHAPAARVWQMAARFMPQSLVQVGQISGTVAAGEMRNIVYQNKQVEKLTWQIRFLPLLILQARGEVRIDINPNAQIKSEFSRFIFGKKITLTQLAYQSDVAFLAPVLNLPLLPVSADIMGDFEEVILVPPQLVPEAITGKITLRDVSYSLIQPAMQFGTYQGNITRVGEKIQLKLTDFPAKSGVNALSARGDFVLLPNRSYQMNITLAGNTPQLVSFIQGFGQKNSSGGVNLTYQGSF